MCVSVRALLLRLLMALNTSIFEFPSPTHSPCPPPTLTDALPLKWVWAHMRLDPSFLWGSPLQPHPDRNCNVRNL